MPRCRSREVRTGTPQGLSGCGLGDRRSRPSQRQIGAWWRPGTAHRSARCGSPAATPPRPGRSQPRGRPARAQPIRSRIGDSGRLAGAPTRVDAHVAAVGPAQFREPLPEGFRAGLVFRIICRSRQEHADASHPAALLRACSERPCCHCAAEQRYERAPFHSITSTAAIRATDL